MGLVPVCMMYSWGLWSEISLRPTGIADSVSRRGKKRVSVQVVNYTVHYEKRGVEEQIPIVSVFVAEGGGEEECLYT